MDVQMKSQPQRKGAATAGSQKVVLHSSVDTPTVLFVHAPVMDITQIARRT